MQSSVRPGIRFYPRFSVRILILKWFIRVTVIYNHEPVLAMHLLHHCKLLTCAMEPAPKRSFLKRCHYAALNISMLELTVRKLQESGIEMGNCNHIKSNTEMTNKEPSGLSFLEHIKRNTKKPNKEEICIFFLDHNTRNTKKPNNEI